MGTAQKITPFLWFTSGAEEAAETYTRIFPDSRITSTTRYSKESAQASGQEEGSVMTVAFELCGQPFTALNGGPVFEFTPGVSLFATCADEETFDRLADGLSGGTILMPIQEYPFAKRYGWIEDPYGVSWQLMLADTTSIVPALMFTGEHAGRAHEAIELYASIFEHSSIDALVPYEENDPDPITSLKHARFTLDGTPFIAMDSHYDHDWTLTSAISFVVNCTDQDEVDRYWNELGAGGTPSQCGWITDRYGVTWQIVPDALPSLISGPDPDGARRATQAMLGMRKLVIAELERAYRNA